MKLDTISALVAGGASGLGEATTRQLVARGAICVILDRDAALGQALADELGRRAIFVAGDIMDPDHIRKALDAATARPLRLAVTCAYTGGAEPVLDAGGRASDLGRFRHIIDVNLVGTFNVLRLAAERMATLPMEADGQRGVVINTSSIAAFDGAAPQIAYTSSKAAVAAMSLSAARDLATHAIRVMSIAPGAFLTPMVAGLPEMLKDQLASLAVFPGRMGIPDEYARLVVHIFENPYLNGDTIRLDGGARLPALARPS